METQEKTQKTLFDLVKGDNIILVAPLGGVWDSGVTRTTKTQIITEALNFYKKNGKLVGGTGCSIFIRLPKKGEVVRLAVAREKRSSIADLLDTAWADYSQEALDKVASILAQDEENR